MKIRETNNADLTEYELDKYFTKSMYFSRGYILYYRIIAKTLTQISPLSYEKGASAHFTANTTVICLAADKDGGLINIQFEQDDKQTPLQFADEIASFLKNVTEKDLQAAIEIFVGNYKIPAAGEGFHQRRKEIEFQELEAQYRNLYGDNMQSFEKPLLF